MTDEEQLDLEPSRGKKVDYPVEYVDEGTKGQGLDLEPGNAPVEYRVSTEEQEKKQMEKIEKAAREQEKRENDIKRKAENQKKREEQIRNLERKAKESVSRGVERTRTFFKGNARPQPKRSSTPSRNFRQQSQQPSRVSQMLFSSGPSYNMPKQTSKRSTGLSFDTPSYARGYPAGGSSLGRLAMSSGPKNRGFGSNIKFGGSKFGGLGMKTMGLKFGASKFGLGKLRTKFKL